MIRVIVESPYAGKGDTREERERNTELHLCYLRACLHDCIARGEAPFASHGLYTQPGVLDDNVPHERDTGIAAGFSWRCVAQKTVVYTDLGISFGMKKGIIDAAQRAQEVEFRSLGENLRTAIKMSNARTEHWGRELEKVSFAEAVALSNPVERGT